MNLNTPPLLHTTRYPRPHRFWKLNGFLGLLSLTAATAMAQNPITWGLPTNIGTDADVRTDGTLVVAFNLGATGVAATTINGVTFQSFMIPDVLDALGTSQTLSGVTFNGTLLGEILTSANTVAGTGGPFTALSSDYQTLLGSVGGSTIPADFQLSYNGLTIGNQYLIQMWTSVSQPSTPSNFFDPSTTTRIRDEGSLNSVTLDANTTYTTPSDPYNGIGQFVTGSFTADATTLRVLMDSTTWLPTLNGFQLRDLGPAAIPEASAQGLWILLGGAGVVSLRRRPGRHSTP
jgi:hypothetical protein